MQEDRAALFYGINSYVENKSGGEDGTNLADILLLKESVGARKVKDLTAALNRQEKSVWGVISELETSDEKIKNKETGDSGKVALLQFDARQKIVGNLGLNEAQQSTMLDYFHLRKTLDDYHYGLFEQALEKCQSSQQGVASFAARQANPAVKGLGDSVVEALSHLGVGEQTAKQKLREYTEQVKELIYEGLEGEGYAMPSGRGPAG